MPGPARGGSQKLRRSSEWTRGPPVSHATLFGKVIPVTTPFESVRSGAKKCSSELSGSPGSSSDSAGEKNQQHSRKMIKSWNTLGCTSPEV